MGTTVYSIQNRSMRLELDLSENTLILWNLINNQRLFICPSITLLCPIIDGKLPSLSLTNIHQEEQLLSLSFTGTEVPEFSLFWDFRGDEVRLSSSFRNGAGKELNALSIMPVHSKLNLYDMVNFRNHHGTPSTWPELCLADDMETTTYSLDWQFAPHPTMLLFRKNETNLLCAPLELPKAFGFHFKVKRYDLAKWELDYGPTGSGEPLSASQIWNSPVFCFLKTEHEAVYDTIDRYCRLLVSGGYIPDPAARQRYRWHRENLYCTWVDQGYIADAKPVMELNKQQDVLLSGAACLNEQLVRNALAIIKKERLPFTTILIDDGWQKALGDWEADPAKFPNFRGLIDELHAAGYKVILWVNFADIEPAANVNEEFLCKGFLNKHGRRFYDYSNPKVQKAYLEPLIRRLCSPEPGCYDSDGIKTDFLADKIHPETPCSLEWRGEENYWFHFFRCFCSMMKKYKPDACHIGCAGHPYLAESMDIIRTYDIFTSNYNEHLERGRMAYHTSAGVPIAFDFHNLCENFDEYFSTAFRYGCSVQIGNIIGKKQDYFSPWEPADPLFYEQLRQGLRKFL